MTNKEQTISNLKKLKSFHNGSYGADIDSAVEALELLDKLDEIITKQIDISNNQVECQTLRWVLDVMSEMNVETSQGWISVSERLPEEKQSVLVWCPLYKNIYCAYLEKGQWWIFGAFVQIVPNEVVAWMPLPKSYKAESEEKE